MQAAKMMYHLKRNTIVYLFVFHESIMSDVV